MKKDGKITARVKPVSKEDIRNTGRIEKVFKLAKYLKNFRTIQEISSHVLVHRKSVHRYLNLLTQLGFKIEVVRKYRHQYRIVNLDGFFKDGNNA